ncbi:peroxisomal assembly protein [Scheffersomyces amazonensis]|uniref:peroxisomal assembly protein n=1 Tax=Scheffersomyces amazonensis TaxID=1078765 RepID=UPI00315D7012
MPSVLQSQNGSGTVSGSNGHYLNGSHPTHESVTTVANVSFVNDPQLFIYNAIELSQDLFTKLFGTDFESTSGDNFVLIKLLGSPDYFTSFKIFKVSSINNRTTNLISFINNSNLSRFPIDKLTLNSATIKSINIHDIPTLSQIYVSLPNEIYRLITEKSNQTIKHLFLNQYLLDSGNVINDNDTIRLINGKVKLCEPLSQGLVNNDTNIVLINQDDDIEHELIQFEESNDESDEEYKLGDSEFYSRLETELDLSTYLQSNLHFNPISSAISSTPTNLHKFRVNSLPERLTIEQLPLNWENEDSELFVFINTSDLVKLNFAVFNGDLIKLNYMNTNNHEDSVIIRIFTFIEPNKSFSLNHVYLSPILLVNLGLNSQSRVTFESIEKSSDSLNDTLPIADSVTISRVCSQITMDKTFQRNFFSSLKTSLSNQFKCVKQGDFFPVVLDSVLSKTIFDHINDSNNSNTGSNDDNATDDIATNDGLDVLPIGDPDSVAWFRIVEINGKQSITNQYIIDPSKTLLVSSGVEFVKLPPNEFYQWYPYLNLPPLFNYNLVSKDFKYAKDFKKILQTCLNSKINLKTTILLNSLSRGIGKTNLVRNMSYELGLNLIELDCIDIINSGQELKTVGVLSGKIDKLLVNQPTNTFNANNNNSYNLIYLKHIESLCPSSDDNDQNSSINTSLSLKIIQLLQEYLNKYSNLIIVMSCNNYEKLNDNIKSLIKFNIEFTVPSEQERLQIFKFLINKEKKQSWTNIDNNQDINDYSFIIRKDINYNTLALQSAGLTPRDLISIIKKSKKSAIKRLTKLSKELNIKLSNLINIGDGGIITWIPEDFNQAINEARNQFSDSIGAPRIPNVKWEDIGGLDLVKDEILDTIDMPLKHPELFNNGLKKRSGILFYGPPGTGKTLLAKAIATNFSLNFFSVKGPELLNMYIGESEANVRRVFQRARDAKPCVIFFDELDSVAPKRGNQGDSGGVMDRIVSQLLAELDGMSSEGGDGVFVVGATNRPDLLDEALLRPGRFDKMLYLGISDTNDKQTKILEALTRKFKLDDDVSLEKIAEKCSFTFTGADFYALCSDSMLNAMTRVANEVDSKIKEFNRNLESEGKETISTRWWFDNISTENDVNVLVKMQDFEKAQQELIPSVSAEELQHYLRVRQNFEGNKEKAANNNNNNTQPVESNGFSNGTANGVANGSEEHISIDFSNSNEN